MNRDNILFLILGALAGFIAGYLVQERMREIQPAPLVHDANVGSAPAAPQGAAPQAAPPSASPPAAAGGAPMEQVERLRRQVEQNPNDAAAVLELANMNFDIANWQRARDLYARYLELQPASPDVVSDLAICERNLGRFEEAVAAFDRAIALAPDHWLARYNKSLVLALDLQDYAGAEAMVAELRRLRPDAAEIDRLEQEIARRRAAG